MVHSPAAKVGIVSIYIAYGPWTIDHLRIPKPLHNTPLRVLNKVDDLVPLNGGVKLCLDNIEGLSHVIFFQEYDPVNFLYLVDRGCRITPAAQAHRIDPDIR